MKNENNNNNLIYLIIGGNGWLGTFLINKLIKIKLKNKNLNLNQQKNIQIYSIDIKDPINNLNIEYYNNKLYCNYICDISNKEELNNIINRIQPDVVFHVATLIDLRVYPSNKMKEVNIDGTNNVIDIMKNLSNDKIRYLIYTSSIDVVATSTGISDANENTPTILNNPSNGYKRTKSTADNIVLTTNYSNLRCCVLRPGHIFGPGDPVISSASFIPIALGPSSARMSFTYIENLAYAHILASRKLIKENKLSISINPSLSSNSLLKDNSNIQYDYMNYPYLTQTPLFIYEYNVNFCDTYRQFAGKLPAFIRIPTILISPIISIVEFLESIFYRLFSRHILQTHPFLSMTASTLEASYFLTINSTRAQKILNYNVDNNNSNNNNNDCSKDNIDEDEDEIEFRKLFRIVSKEEAIRRTKYWIETGEFYVE